MKKLLIACVVLLAGPFSYATKASEEEKQIATDRVILYMKGVHQLDSDHPIIRKIDDRLRVLMLGAVTAEAVSDKEGWRAIANTELSLGYAKDINDRLKALQESNRGELFVDRHVPNSKQKELDHLSGTLVEHLDYVILDTLAILNQAMPEAMGVVMDNARDLSDAHIAARGPSKTAEEVLFGPTAGVTYKLEKVDYCYSCAHPAAQK